MLRLNAGIRGSTAERRRQLITKLKAEPKDDLVLVWYGAGHSTLNEWVYNEADIDKSSVVFARSMGESLDREIMDYYPDRNVWRANFVRDELHLERIR